jgi:acetyltransferase-like isoleucine patch superfamily enzyme
MRLTIHPTALVESVQIGEGSRIWAFVHVLPGVQIGRNCNIGDHCYLEEGVRLGDGVVVKNGVSLWSGVTLGDRAFVGPNVSFTNDRLPRAKQFHSQHQRTAVSEGASVGANATILCGLTIGRYAMVGAGAVVTRDIPDYGLVFGNPACLKGFVCRCGRRLMFSCDRATCECGLRFTRRGGAVREAS